MGADAMRPYGLTVTRAVPCPECRVKPGAWCVKADGKPAKRPHEARVRQHSWTLRSRRNW